MKPTTTSTKVERADSRGEVVIRSEGLTFSYGKRQTLSEISVQFQPGIHGILGANGAGKTTLLRILATEMKAHSGTLYIQGQQISTYADARRARSAIGYLPQRVSGTGSLTAIQLIRYVATLRGMSGTSMATAAQHALAAVDLADRADSKVSSLSGGMQQRVSLACALVGNPPIMILDEPTVGLDPSQRFEFKEILRQHTDATILLSTHIVEDIAAVASDVVVVHAGRIVFCGSTEELARIATPGIHADTPLERGYLSVIHQAASI